MTVSVTSLSWGVGNDGGYIRVGTTDVKTAARIADSVEDGKEYEIEIRPRRRRRSLDANAYMWLLLGKLEAALNRNGRLVTKEEIYRECIREVGDNFDIVPIRAEAVERWVANWHSRGLGWITENLGESKTAGYYNIVCYYGSSVYTPAQMKQLTDIVVQECRQQGIETMTPEQLARLTEE